MVSRCIYRHSCIIKSAFSFRFVPKNHQSVAPYHVRNPRYDAMASAQSISLTRARISADEYRHFLKRSFPAAASAAEETYYDWNGGAKMKKCNGESDVPEDIRARLRNVVWSREEKDRDVSQAEPEGDVVGKVGTFEEGGKEQVEPFEFKKRNAWEIHKSQRRQQGDSHPESKIMLSDPPLPDFEETSPSDLPALIPIAIPKSATPKQHLLKRPPVAAIQGQQQCKEPDGETHNRFARPQPNSDFLRMMAAAGWHYYDPSSRKDTGLGDGNSGCDGGGGRSCKSQTQPAAAREEFWPPNHHLANAKTNGAQASRDVKQIRAMVPKSEIEANINCSQKVATSEASDGMIGGLDAHGLPANPQWRLYMERQQQVAL